MKNYERQAVDLNEYIHRTKKGLCFICELIAGNPDFRHHIVYEDDQAIAFLDKYTTLAGHVLLAPKQHIEHVISDFPIDEYLNYQRLLYRLGEAIQNALPTERLYIFSLGSQQGNSHVHWHLAPLPPGIPYENQQFEALMMENGVLDISDKEMISIASKIRYNLNNI